MSIRLQVLLDEPVYRRVQRLAKARGVTLAAWVRDALDAAAREEPGTDIGKKLKAIRAAAAHGFPTADIEQMNAEIARGYGALPDESSS